MEYRDYGRTGKKISVIGAGGMRFDDPEDIDANAGILLHAYRRGINYFDTAPGYCKDRSEEIVAAAIARMEPGTFFVSSKSSARSGSEFRRSLERSLERLGLDCLPFFHIWCVLSPAAWEERRRGGVLRAARQARDEGLIEHIVVSTHMSGSETAELVSRGEIEGLTIGYCAINFPYRQQGITAAARAGLGVVTMNPLGGGLIPRHAARFDFIRTQGDPDVVTAALRFILAEPAVTCALVGFSRREQVDQAVDAVTSRANYDRQQRRRIEGRLQRGFDGLCTGCGYCMPCPQGVPIPKLMDAWNYHELGSGDKGVLQRLRGHWQIDPRAAGKCVRCGLCEERCTQHLEIMDRLAHIARMRSQK